MSKLAGPPRRKINVTSKSPVGDISVVTLIRTDTTLDHSQKAAKVWASRVVTSIRGFFVGRLAVCGEGGENDATIGGAPVAKYFLASTEWQRQLVGGRRLNTQ